MLRTDAMDAMYRPSAEAQRALADLQISTSTDVLGGFLIPPDTAAYSLLQQRMKAFMGVEREALVLTHSNDRDFPVPQLDRTGEAGESLGEGAPATAQGDLALTQVVLKSNRVSSKSLQVPAAVLRSFAVEAEPLIMSMLAESAGRRKAAQYANGTGTAPQSTGIRTALGVAAYQHTLAVKYDISDGNWNKSAAGTAGTSQAAEIPIEMLSQLDSAYWGVGGTIVMHPGFLSGDARRHGQRRALSVPGTGESSPDGMTAPLPGKGCGFRSIRTTSRQCSERRAPTRKSPPSATTRASRFGTLRVCGCRGMSGLLT